MKESTVDTIERVGAVATTALGTLDPITGIFAGALKEWCGKFTRIKVEEAKDILMTEIRHAEAWDRLKQDPEGAAVRTLRYIHAATVGAAHENLRILARLSPRAGRPGRPVWPIR